MYTPDHPDDGLTVTGSLTISPPLDADECDRLEAIAMVSTNAALDDRPSEVLALLVPGHPAGPSSWVACRDGCCLELEHRLPARVDALEPWLDYIVGDLFDGHAFEGSLVLFDHADRSFTALQIEQGRVRRRGILGKSELRPRGRGARGSGGRRLRSV